MSLMGASLATGRSVVADRTAMWLNGLKDWSCKRSIFSRRQFERCNSRGYSALSIFQVHRNASITFSLAI